MTKLSPRRTSDGFEIHSDGFLEIQQRPDGEGLERRLRVVDEGDVVCRCDGTFRAVKDCLAKSEALRDPKSPMNARSNLPHLPFSGRATIVTEVMSGVVNQTAYCAAQGAERFADMFLNEATLASLRRKS